MTRECHLHLRNQINDIQRRHNFTLEPMGSFLKSHSVGETCYKSTKHSPRIYTILRVDGAEIGSKESGKSRREGRRREEGLPRWREQADRSENVSGSSNGTLNI